jgi:hypothetical protein
MAERVSRHWWLVFGVENERCVLETALDVAVRPVVGRLAHRHLAFGVILEILVRPLDLGHVQGRRRSGLRAGCRRRNGLARPGIALDARVRAARPQAHKRVHHMRKRFVSDLDLFDRVRSSQFIDGCES